MAKKSCINKKRGVQNAQSPIFFNFYICSTAFFDKKISFVYKSAYIP